MSDVTGFFYPRTATGRASLLPAPPWHYSGDLLTVEYRTDPARIAETAAGAAPARAAGPRRGGADLGRLAVLWRRRRRVAGPGPGAVPRMLRGCPVQLRREGVLALRLHLGRRRLRPGPRPAPGLPEEAGVDSPDPAAPVRPRGPADSGRRGVRGHARRGRPAAGPGRGDAARGGRRQRVSRPSRPGAATHRSSCSSRPRKSWPGSRSGRSSAATTVRSASPGTVAGCSPAAPHPSSPHHEGEPAATVDLDGPEARI